MTTAETIEADEPRQTVYEDAPSENAFDIKFFLIVVLAIFLGMFTAMFVAQKVL